MKRGCTNVEVTVYCSEDCYEKDKEKHDQLFHDGNDKKPEKVNFWGFLSIYMPNYKCCFEMDQFGWFCAENHERKKCTNVSRSWTSFPQREMDRYAVSKLLPRLIENSERILGSQCISAVSPSSDKAFLTLSYGDIVTLTY